VVHCVEQVDVPDLDLRDLTVDPTLDPASAFSVVPAASPAGLHHPVEVAPAESHPDSRAESVPVVTVPYHSWANRGLTTMRVRFDRR
jgi:hypothetical protein